MTDTEVNKIIAEYMGIDISVLHKHHFEDKESRYDNYTESLDSLVPVWERLESYKLNFEYEPYDSIGWFLDIEELKDYRDGDDNLFYTIQQAAAHATAKAILELNER